MQQTRLQDQQEIATDQERRRLFLRYLNQGWLILGLVTLASMPFFPEQRGEFSYVAAIVFPTYLLIRFLNRSGRTRLAGVVFTLTVNFGFYGLFLLLVREMGAEEAFRTQATVWQLMGLAVLFAGAFVDKWAAPGVALFDTVLLIVTQQALAPESGPRPSVAVFWWMMAAIIWLYETTLQQALAHAWGELAERKRTEAELRLSEARYRAVVENQTEFIVRWKPDGVRTFANESYNRYFGLTPSQTVSASFLPLVVEEDRRAVEEKFSRLLSGSVTSESDAHRVIKPDGTIGWQEWVDQAIYDASGQIAEFLSVGRDITERKHAEERLRESEVRYRLLAGTLELQVAARTRELAEANVRLTELDQLKSKFVSDVSHELRTPIANLKIYIDLLTHGRPEKHAQYIAVLEQQIKRVVELVDNILELSRLEQRKAQGGIYQAVALNEVVEQVVTALQPRAEAAGLLLMCVLAHDLPLAHGDANQLAQVITNLVVNALNYTPAGYVRVSTHAQSDQVCLRVTDSGSGIAPEDLPHVFERFYRGQRVPKNDVPGTGLGLAIVKEIVDLHSGRIEVDSQLGQGTTFTVQLKAA